MRFRTKPVHFSIVCVILKQYLSNVHCFTCITFTLNFSNSSFSSQQRCYYRGLTVQYDTEIRLQRTMVLYSQRRYVYNTNDTKHIDTTAGSYYRFHLNIIKRKHGVSKMHREIRIPDSSHKCGATIRSSIFVPKRTWWFRCSIFPYLFQLRSLRAPTALTHAHFFRFTNLVYPRWRFRVLAIR